MDGLPWHENIMSFWLLTGFRMIWLKRCDLGFSPRAWKIKRRDYTYYATQPSSGKFVSKMCHISGVLRCFESFSVLIVPCTPVGEDDKLDFCRNSVSLTKSCLWLLTGLMFYQQALDCLQRIRLWCAGNLDVDTKVSRQWKFFSELPISNFNVFQSFKLFCFKISAS